MKRRTFLTSASAAGLAGLAGCSTVKEYLPGGSPEPQEVTLGVLMPETGDLAPLTKPIRDSALLAAKDVQNAELDLVTLDSQVEDTKTDKQAAVDAANLLTNRGIPAMVGPASSESAEEIIKEVYKPRDVVGISPSATSPKFTSMDDGGNFYRTAPSDALQARVLAQIATDRLGTESASVLHLRNGYGEALANSFADAYAGEVKHTVPFPKAESSYVTELQKALSDDPASLVVIGYPKSGKQLFKDFYDNFENVSDIPILITDGMVSEDLPSKVGNPMTNVWGTAPSASGPGYDTWEQRFIDTYDYEEASVFTPQAYDAAATVILSTVRAGAELSGDEELTGPDVRSYITNVTEGSGETITPDNIADGVRLAAKGEDVTYEGASGLVKYDDAGDVVGVEFEIYSYTSDGLTVEDTMTFE